MFVVRAASAAAALETKIRLPMGTLQAVRSGKRVKSLGRRMECRGKWN